MRSPAPFLLAGSAMLLAPGCAGVGLSAAAGVGVFAVQERTIGEGIDDAAASAAIKARLMRADARGFSRVDVEVAAGQVLLTGVAPTEEHKTVAEQVAREQPQVSAVANEILVGPPAGLFRSARDEWISAEVRTRLLADDQTRALDVNVETHEGVVYLMGVVRTAEEVRATAEIASRVAGVRRVISFVMAREAGAATRLAGG